MNGLQTANTADVDRCIHKTIEAHLGVGTHSNPVESSTSRVHSQIPMDLMALWRVGLSSYPVFVIVVYSEACIGPPINCPGGYDTVVELLMGMSSRGACAPSTLFLLVLSLLHAMLHITQHDPLRDVACLS